jgi:hypothetical protein
LPQACRRPPRQRTDKAGGGNERQVLREVHEFAHPLLLILDAPEIVHAAIRRAGTWQ